MTFSGFPCVGAFCSALDLQEKKHENRVFNMALKNHLKRKIVKNYSHFFSGIIPAIKVSGFGAPPVRLLFLDRLLFF